MEDTLEYQDALKEATHQGVNTGTLYRFNPESLSCDFFGASSLGWYRSGVQNSQLDNEKSFRKL